MTKDNLTTIDAYLQINSLFRQVYLTLPDNSLTVILLAHLAKKQKNENDKKRKD
jgi:hypothetical protein